MSFWGHLDELRKVLFKIAGVVILVSIVMFIAMPYVFDTVVLAPTHHDFPLYALFDAIMPPEPGTPPFDIDNVRLHSSCDMFSYNHIFIMGIYQSGTLRE